MGGRVQGAQKGTESGTGLGSKGRTTALATCRRAMELGGQGVQGKRGDGEEVFGVWLQAAGASLQPLLPYQYPGPVPAFPNQWPSPSLCPPLSLQVPFVNEVWLQAAGASLRPLLRDP